MQSVQVKTRESSILAFLELSSLPRFQGWPIVEPPKEMAKIPFFGSVIGYKLETGNGVEEYCSIIRSFGWVVVFGVTTSNEVITLVQWKPGVNKASWELPPGGIGKLPSETSPDEIMRLTQESYLKETGYGGGTWSHLNQVMIETGKYRGASADDHGLPAYLMMATGLEKIQGSRNPNKNEIIETLLVPLEEFDAVIDSGLFIEASALPCALLALRKLK